MSATWVKRLLFLVLLPACAHSQAVSCTSSHTTAECEDGDGNVTYVICSGQYCTSGSYHRTLEERQMVVDMVYKPMFHRNALCGLDDASGELFPSTDKPAQKVREPLLPKKNCTSSNLYFGGAKTFEKLAADLCSAKKLDAKQCSVLARDIQHQRELDKVGQ
jgi:hypothetical protein